MLKDKGFPASKQTQKWTLK